MWGLSIRNLAQNRGNRQNDPGRNVDAAVNDLPPAFLYHLYYKESRERETGPGISLTLSTQMQH